MATITKPPCFLGDSDYLDGRSELNVPKGALKAYWDADILDADGVRPERIIGTDDEFKVRFRVELCGDLWGCICGTWCFDVGFTPIGEGKNFNLSTYVKKEKFEIRDWRGCDGTCIELCVTVPAGTIPSGDCSTVYEVAATYELHCCDSHVVLVGYEALEEFQFYLRHTP